MNNERILLTSIQNHYSEISTVEANWDLHTLGRWDVGANVFDMVAQVTGDIVGFSCTNLRDGDSDIDKQYRPNDAATSKDPSIFYNSSFAGPFNTEFQKAPYSAPNLNIVSPKTGRTVLPAIKRVWNSKAVRRSGLKSY